ncbi:hypothetical protein [Nioella sp.]|uniref:hypothetical protein n=1 Tax=Nioella sp. TaxID=1912091 RepID=UPI003A85FCD8
MAKDKKTRSKRSVQAPRRRKSAADHRAAHRRHSAASAERKREAGLTRVSVWVPAGAADILKRFAKRLCEGHAPDDIGRAQAGDGRIRRGGSIQPQPRKKRKAMPCDARQLDLFGPS